MTRPILDLITVYGSQVKRIHTAIMEDEQEVIVQDDMTRLLLMTDRHITYPPVVDSQVDNFIEPMTSNVQFAMTVVDSPVPVGIQYNTVLYRNQHYLLELGYIYTIPTVLVSQFLANLGPRMLRFGTDATWIDESIMDDFVNNQSFRINRALSEHLGHPINVN